MSEPAANHSPDPFGELADLGEQPSDGLYLCTREDGLLFFSDLPAKVGGTLRAIRAPEPFPDRGLWAADTPSGALAHPGAQWPCALWRVSGLPAGRVCPGVWRFDQLQVLGRVDPSLALGPCAQTAAGFLRSLRFLRADALRPADTVEDEWYRRYSDDDEDSPSYRCYARACVLINETGLDWAHSCAREYAERTVAWTADHYFDAGRLAARRDGPFERLREGLIAAVHMALAALLVENLLDEPSVRMLCENWRRFTGRDVFSVVG